MPAEIPSGTLKHLCPETHSEEQFAELVKSIPKFEADHLDQAKHIQELVKGKKWKVGRILDVGGGEGTFTELVLKLLKANGACAGATPLQVHIIEKDDVLWRKCKRRLGRPGIELKRVEVSAQEYDAFELPNNRKALLAFADRLSNGGAQRYDLIVASHVTYYFDNAGAELAYALGSRLLAPTGFMWFVVRDRDCPFYRYREKLLAEHRLPDIHRECFSDAFLDRLRSLVADPGNDSKPTIFTQVRKLSLEVSAGDNATGLVSYLLWLSGLKANEVEEAAARGGAKDGFTETHIWISPIIKILEDESRILTEVHVSARCIDIIRRIAPDIQTHRVSLASVVPHGRIPDITAAARVDLEFPIIMPTFDLSSVGYACEHAAGESTDPLDQFFKTNTSFLFFRRFYHDYQIESDGPASKQSSYSVVRKLIGNPKIKIPSCYPRRSADKSIKSPDSPTAMSERRSFVDSFDAWVKVLSDYYCSLDASSDSQLYTICVGCNILPELRDVISKTQDLNTSCALFLTVSTTRDLERLAPDFIGQIKARLAQWIAEDLYQRLQKKMEELNKQAQMLELMARPLRGINDALSRMQTDTQNLRALMFEPEESLFASHSNIEPFFREGQPLPVKFKDCEDICIHHNPDAYDLAECKTVLACVMCAVFGKVVQSGKLLDREAFLKKAKTILDAVEEEPATSRLTKDLKWLVKCSGKFGSVLDGDKSVQVSALNRIKAALFSPFKVGSGAWDPIAFQLLQQNETLKGCLLKGELLKNDTLPKYLSPISYAAVLAFVRDITAALVKRDKGGGGRCVESLDWSMEGEICTCAIGFSTSIPNDRYGLDRELLKSTLRLVAESCPREWRIQDDNYGDSTRPFVYLVNKILGLGPDENSEWRVGGLKGEEVFAVVTGTINGETVRFSIVCKDAQIQLVWAKTQGTS